MSQTMQALLIGLLAIPAIGLLFLLLSRKEIPSVFKAFGVGMLVAVTLVITLTVASQIAPN